MCGGILELLQGGVDFQCLCKGSCALRANLVLDETGGGEGDKSSAADNALEIMEMVDAHLSSRSELFVLSISQMAAIPLMLPSRQM